MVPVERCRVRSVIDKITGRFLYLKEKTLSHQGRKIFQILSFTRRISNTIRRMRDMKHLEQIQLLEDRLHRLERNGKENEGICQKIRRQIDNLKEEERR